MHVVSRAKDSCTHILDVLSNMIMRPHPMVITIQAPHTVGRYDPVRVTITPESADTIALLREYGSILFVIKVRKYQIYPDN